MGKEISGNRPYMEVQKYAPFAKKSLDAETEGLKGAAYAGRVLKNIGHRLRVLGKQIQEFCRRVLTAGEKGKWINNRSIENKIRNKITKLNEYLEKTSEIKDATLALKCALDLRRVCNFLANKGRSSRGTIDGLTNQIKGIEQKAADLIKPAKKAPEKPTEKQQIIETTEKQPITETPSPVTQEAYTRFKEAVLNNTQLRNALESETGGTIQKPGCDDPMEATQWEIIENLLEENDVLQVNPQGLQRIVTWVKKAYVEHLRSKAPLEVVNIKETDKRLNF